MNDVEKLENDIQHKTTELQAAELVLAGMRKQLAHLKSVEAEPFKGVPLWGAPYYYFDSTGELVHTTSSESDLDEYRWRVGNVFKTPTEAERYTRWRVIDTHLRRAAAFSGEGTGLERAEIRIVNDSVEVWSTVSLSSAPRFATPDLAEEAISEETEEELIFWAKGVYS